MSEVRNVQITGGAVDHYRKERAGGVTRRRRKVEHEGGDAPPGVPLLGPANMGAVKIIGGTLASVLELTDYRETNRVFFKGFT